jgi:hypothetical protein
MADMMVNLAPILTYRIILCKKQTSITMVYNELVTVNGNYLFFTDWANDSPAYNHISFPDTITTTPLSITNTLIVTTKDCIYSVKNFSIQDYISLPGTICIAGYDNNVIILKKD